MSIRKARVAAIASAIVLGASAMLAPTAGAATKTVIVWAGADKAPGVIAALKGYKAVTVKVVVHDEGKIREDLKTIAAKDAPDVIVGTHDWVGELSSNGSIIKLSLPAPVKKQFSANSVGAWSYNGALYGLPLSVESIAFLQNTAMVGDKCYPTLDAFLAKANTVAGLTTPIQVGNDSYHMYPMLSGLGGYVFGQKANGALDPGNIGLDTQALLKNSSIIDGWQASGLFQNYLGNYDGLTGLYGTGKAAAWITGPWNTGAVKDIESKNGIKTKFCTFPTIVPGIKSVPFSGLKGLMVTKFAAGHGVSAQAKTLVTTVLSTVKAQNIYAKTVQANPANLKAKNPDPVLAGFGVTSANAIPMPNIPEMGSVWDSMQAAWAKALKKTDPTKAKTAFLQAASNIRELIG
jgi:arabinogalactan oligomer/maltooligosaccharide transport system substrate-binding protein